MTRGLGALTIRSQQSEDSTVAERSAPPPANWEDRFEAKTDLARMVIESRRRRRANGERFLAEEEIDAYLNRADEPHS